MILSNQKTKQRIELIDDTRLGIINYGLGNDYPQKCRELVAASGTATLAVNMLKNFIEGQGFEDLEFYLRNDNLLSLIVEDLAYHNGFYLHINRNLLMQVVEVQHIPFEHCRFSVNKNEIFIHKDWGRRTYKRFEEKEIEKFPIFNKNKTVIQSYFDKDGFEKYKGEIFFSGLNTTYPLAIYDSVITDIASEDGMATIMNRGIKSNWMPRGAWVRKGNPAYFALKQKAKSELTESEIEILMQFDREMEQSGSALEDFQGSENSFSMMEIVVGSDEEMPKFIEFPITNFDNLFEVTIKNVQNNIGNVFNQPPVLRGQLVSGKMGTATEMQDAFYFYNFMTNNIRRKIERCFEYIFKGEPVGNLSNNYKIIPLSYGTQTVNQ